MRHEGADAAWAWRRHARQSWKCPTCEETSLGCYGNTTVGDDTLRIREAFCVGVDTPKASGREASRSEQTHLGNQGDFPGTGRYTGDWATA